MKALFMKAALLTLLGGITLSAGAKPAEVQQWNNPISVERQSSNLVVASRGKTAAALQTVTAVVKDIPISAAKP